MKRNTLVLACLAASLFAGGCASRGEEAKEQASEACTKLAELRSPESVLDNAEIQLTTVAGEYRVSGIVKTPGLPDEDFVGIAKRSSDGDFICEMG